LIVPTLAEQRAATGRSINAAFDSGKSAAEARRAIGKRIEAERRGESVVEDLNRLIIPARQRRTLRPVQPVGAVPVTRGRGNYTPPPATSPGGGIASPLIEGAAALREWWPAGWPSTDGIFEYPAEKRVLMTDANGAEVEFQYSSPTP
jgi:hypothetical protein